MNTPKIDGVKYNIYQDGHRCSVESPDFILFSEHGAPWVFEVSDDATEDTARGEGTLEYCCVMLTAHLAYVRGEEAGADAFVPGERDDEIDESNR